MPTTQQLYGAAIALVSGLYSLWSVYPAAELTTSGWLMLLVGLVVVVHGVALLTPSAERLAGASGPLMIGYAVVMLLTQALLGAGMMDDGSGMGGGMGAGMGDAMSGGMGSPTAGMGWDAGMAALALLMLISGLVMTARGSMDDGSGGM